MIGVCMSPRARYVQLNYDKFLLGKVGRGTKAKRRQKCAAKKKVEPIEATYGIYD
jgi:hypothetical protein